VSRRIVSLVNAQCRLAARPVGLPQSSDWSYIEEPAPEPADGEFRVQLEYISLDPAMRARIRREMAEREP